MSEQAETLRPAVAALSPAELERREFRQGQRDVAGALPGIFAWSIVTAMAMVKTGLTTSQALGMTLIVYAGSAQLAALPLIAAGAPVMVVFITALVVNLRFVIFAASTGPHFAHLPWWRRMVLGYINGDLVMATFPRRYPYSTVNERPGKLGYFTGCSYTNWCTWQIGALVGILLANQIPESWNIGYAGNLALLGLMIPLLRNMPSVAGVLVASALAVMFHAWPYKLGMLSGVVAGVAVAVALEGWQTRGGKRKEIE